MYRATQAATSLRGMLTGNRIAAIIVWFVGVWTTGMALQEMGIPADEVFLKAGALQLILTIGQRPLWRHSRFAFVGIVFVGVDVFFNFGGIWPFAQNIDKTTAWAAFVAAFYGTQVTALAWARAGFGLIVSLAIAAGVEWLWYEAS